MKDLFQEYEEYHGVTTSKQNFQLQNKSTMMIVKERELEKDRTIKDEKYMHEVVQAEEKLGLGNDTYAMAFKAFNWKVIDELDMD